MKKITLVIMALLIGTFVFTPLYVPSFARAEEGEEQTQTEAEKKAAELKAEAAKKAAEQREEALKKAEEQKKEAEEKRKEALKKACENRRESFKKRMEGIAERSSKRREVFEKIADRVEAFIEAKNIVVPNYEALRADVQAKRETLKQTHDAVKELADDFDCDKENGKENVATFKEALHSEIEAFKAFKEAQKTLINAIKEAVRTAEGGAENETE